MRKTGILFVAVLAIAGFAMPAQAGTLDSPTVEGTLPAGVSVVGGIVFDAIGTNGTRVVSQLSASSLFSGFAGTNPFTIGTQTGFTPAVLAALGGGLSEASVRFTLFDGDTAPGDFDDGENTLLLNGIDFGDWSDVPTLETDGTGVLEPVAGNPGLGFNDDELRTGFFHLTDAGKLGSLFTSMAGGSIAFGLDDVDPFDNFFDFTLGLDGSLIDVGTGPVVNPSAVPLPSAAWMGLGLLGLFGAVKRVRRRK